MPMLQASQIQTAAVLGAGTMGHGIAQVLAQCGIEVRLYDIAPGAVERGLAGIRASLEKGVAKGKVAPAERDAALARIRGTTQIAEAIAGAQCVVEAVPEKLELKQKLFAKLGDELPAQVLLATN